MRLNDNGSITKTGQKHGTSGVFSTRHEFNMLLVVDGINWVQRCYSRYKWSVVYLN